MFSGCSTEVMPDLPSSRNSQDDASSAYHHDIPATEPQIAVSTRTIFLNKQVSGSQAIYTGKRRQREPGKPAEGEGNGEGVFAKRDRVSEVPNMARM